MAEGGLRRGMLPRLVREHGGFLLLAVAAAALYVAVAAVQWYNMDEGAYLNAASTVARGGVPFVTFAAREPVLIYYLAAGVGLFGPHLFVARLQIVLADLFTGAAVYLLGKELGGKKVGLAAAGLFFFNPFDVYTFTTVLLEPLAALPLAWAAYFLLRKKTPDTFRIPLVVGLLLGIAELTRRDAILLTPLLAGALLVRVSPSTFSARTKAFVFLLVGFALPLGLVLGYFTSATSVTWMWNQYGLGSAYVDHTVPLNYHLSVFYYLWVYEPVLIIPASLVPAGALAARGKQDLAFVALLMSALLLGFVLYTGPPNFDWGQGEYEFAATGAMLAVQVMLWMVGALDLEFSESPGPKVSTLALVFLGGWAVFYLGFYTFVYPEFLSNYFTDVSVPLSLLAGWWWADRALRPLARAVEAPPPAARPKDRAWVEGVGALLITTVLVGSALFSAVEVLGPSNPYNQPTAFDLPQYNLIQRTYSPQTVSQVAAYLDAHSPPNATLFSADDIFLAEADRANLLNLSIVLDHMAYNPYPDNQSTYSYDPYHLAPSMDYLLRAWNHTWVPLVVVGNRQATMDEMHPVIQSYLEERYHLVASFGNALAWNYVGVWALGPAPAAPATQTASFPAGPQPSSLALDTENGTLFSGSLNSATLTAISPSEIEWTYTLPYPGVGVRALSYDPVSSSLWLALAGPGPLSSEVARLSLSNGSSPSLLGTERVGYAPVAITFDSHRHLAFVASLGFSNVTVFNASTGGFVTNYRVGAGPLAIVVDPVSRTLYEAASGEAYLEAYNETTGAPIASIFVGAPPTNVVLTPQYFLVTSWSPGEVYWVNRTTGSIDYNASVGSGAQGLAVSGNTVAVASQEAGMVSFFNTTSALPEGELLTQGCPNALAFSANLGSLFVVGPCESPLTAWRMAHLVNWTVDLPEAGGVFVDGSFVPSGAPFQVFPGLFSVVTSVNGRITFGTFAYVTGSGTWLAPVGPSLSGITATMHNFTLGAAAGASLVILLIAAFPFLSTWIPYRPKLTHPSTGPPPPSSPPPSPRAVPPREK